MLLCLELQTEILDGFDTPLTAGGRYEKGSAHIVLTLEFRARPALGKQTVGTSVSSAGSSSCSHPHMVRTLKLLVEQSVAGFVRRACSPSC